MEAPGGVAFDLDGSLAYYDHFRGVDHIGEPIPASVAKVKALRKEGVDVRIFTARVSPITLAGRARDAKEAEDELRRVITAIYKWMVEHLGEPLPITCTKDYQMVVMYEDRAIQLIPNTGLRADGLDL